MHFAVFWIYPLIFSIYISFFSWDGLSPLDKTPFVGLGNYQELVSSTVFWTSVKNTIIYSIANVPLTMIFALVLAMMLNQARIKGMRVFRIAAFAPRYTSTVVLSLIWSFMYLYPWGLFNQFLMMLGLEPINFLFRQDTALWSLLVMNLWMWMGWNSVISLAGLQDIPRDYYDSAEVDGASAWQRFRHITLPMLKPTLLFQLVTLTVASFQIFGAVLMMTDGGPGNSTNVLVFLMYQYAFRWNKFGTGAAVAILLFAIIFAITIVELRLFRKGGAFWY